MSANGPSPQRVAVIGGGLAGLAASTALASQGVSVDLFESRPRLGGRATSFDDKQTGDLVDNCQHVSMGCCTNLQRFCDEMGIADQFETVRSLTFFDANGRSSRFEASSLPTPLHLGRALAGLKYLSVSEKLDVASGIRRLAHERRFDGPFLHWLYSAGQSERVRRLFWHVVLVSALSESLDHISTQVARKVFVDGFLRHRHAWEVHLPKTSLDELYGEPVMRRFAERGVSVHLNTGIDRLEACESGFRVMRRAGDPLEADRIVLAVPHHRVGGLAGDEWKDRDEFQAASSLTPAPITSVHLWFDRQITELGHAVFVEHLSQWMFRRASSREGLHYYQVVVSASFDLAKRSRESIVDEVCRDLETAFPPVAEAQLKHSRVVTEKRAVFSPTPASQQIRPAQRTSVPGLYLAGDWTWTGWPATMEGAVRSGYLAAEALLADIRQPTKLVAKDLPAAWLSRLLRLVD